MTTSTMRRQGHPCTPPPLTCVFLSTMALQMTVCPFFIFYCYPVTATRRRRQGCPCTPPPPTCVVLSAAALPMTACLFYFLLLPVDNNDDKEARLSSYPAAPDMRLIICFGAANERVPLFFIAAHWRQRQQGGKVILISRHPQHALMTALLFISIYIRGASNDRVLSIFYWYRTMTTTTMKRQDYPCTVPPPTRVVLLAVEQPMRTCLFYLFQPVHTTATRRQCCPRKLQPPRHVWQGNFFILLIGIATRQKWQGGWQGRTHTPLPLLHVQHPTNEPSLCIIMHGHLSPKCYVSDFICFNLLLLNIRQQVSSYSLPSKLVILCCWVAQNTKVTFDE